MARIGLRPQNDRQSDSEESMTASKTGSKKLAKKASEEAETEAPTVACLVPAGRETFALHEVSELWRCSVNHLSRLVDQKEIVVPQENIDRAVSRPAIRVPRASLVAFIQRRLARPISPRVSAKKVSRKKTIRRKYADR
jgi:hypothetical protein